MQKNILCLLCSLILLGCGGGKPLSSGARAEKTATAHFATNGFGNAVAVVQHPAGVYHQGVTYLCYQGPREDPYVVSYNHTTDEWDGPYKAGVSAMGKDPSRKKRIDNHGKPSLIIDDAGYIHIAFGGHGGMPIHGENHLGNHHYGKNLHAVSEKPLDISGWKTLDNIPPFGTYNQFIKMDNGDLYLFYRHGAHRSNWVYQVSTDNGRTFSEPVSFLKHKRRTDQAAVDSWYPYIQKGQGDELIVVFDYHLCSDRSSPGLGHVPKRYNLYYMVMDTKTGKWRNVQNEPLTMPLTKEEADAKALVTRTDGHWTFQGVADLDPQGNPYLGVTVGKDINSNRSDPKTMALFHWDGTSWAKLPAQGLPVGNGDFVVGADKRISLYLENYRATADAGEVIRWESTDNGASFEPAEVLLRRPQARFSISSLIRNPHPDARIVVAEKLPGTDDRRMYLLGDNGVVVRRTSTPVSVLAGQGEK